MQHKKNKATAYNSPFFVTRSFAEEQSVEKTKKNKFKIEKLN